MTGGKYAYPLDGPLACSAKMSQGGERERARAKARPGQAKVNSAQSSPADPIPVKQCVERKVAGREKTRKPVGVGNRSETTMREARQETRQG